MALCNSLLLLFFFFIIITITFSSSIQESSYSFSVSLPLTSVSLSPDILSSLASSSSPTHNQNHNQTPSPYSFRSSFKYSMALIVPLPIGTPPQTQQMVLDTGSQLSWIQCHNKAAPIRPIPTPPATTTFDPSLSSSFSVLPCNHPLCKPRIPDFTLPTSCDQNRRCHYSYFYADGTLAEGNLVREKFTFSSTQTTPPLALGCATSSRDAEGILGMNLGRLSFSSQAKLSKFSYCVPPRQHRAATTDAPRGAFYIGRNPNSDTFRYVDLLTFDQGQRMPNLDPLAYTVPMAGMRVGGKRLNISAAAFRPDAGGSGQTIVDSGTEYTYLVEEAYDKVREEIVRSVGPKLKKGYVYGGAMDMCFDGGDDAAEEIGRSVGDMVLEFEKGVEIVVDEGRILAEVEDGVHCVGIGRSSLLGVPSNIIGNFHQQNLWVEFDLTDRRVGFGKADCSRSV